jgi:O-antigen ligase
MTVGHKPDGAKVTHAFRRLHVHRMEPPLQTFASLDNNVSSDKVSKKKLIIPSVFFLSAVVTAAVPLLTWLFLLLIAVALIVPVLRRGKWRELIRPNPTLIALLMFAAYVFASAAWAADRGVALTTAALLLAVILVTFVACRALQHSDQQQLRSAAIAFAAGAFLGALFVVLELLTNGALTRSVMSATTLLKVSPKHFHLSDGDITKMKAAVLNHNAAIVTFGLWPGLLALRTLVRGTYRAVLTGLFFAAVAAVVFISEHQSSQMALIASVPTFWLAWVWRKLAIRVLAIVWCAAFVLVLPLDFVAYKADLHMASWMPDSFRARIIIWEYTAERVFEHPWFGIGANCTHVLAKPERDVSDQPEGFVYPRTTGWHAHDLFLQTWYELGLIGAILIAAAGAVLVTRMTLLPVESQPFAVASFTVFMVIAAFAWGMWQAWLVCAVGLLVLYFQTAARATGGEHRTESEIRTLS